MDDPDVDHELIALLRESLGFSNKAQVGISSNTGKAHGFFVTDTYFVQHATLLHYQMPVTFLYAVFVPSSQFC